MVLSEPVERLLSALDPEQRQVAETLRGPARVLAGAGTCKTRAITHRIAHGVLTGVTPTEVLACASCATSGRTCTAPSCRS